MKDGIGTTHFCRSKKVKWSKKVKQRHFGVVWCGDSVVGKIGCPFLLSFHAITGVQSSRIVLWIALQGCRWVILDEWMLLV